MVTIGNTTLPGVETTVESSRSIGVLIGSPGDVGIVGQANLKSGVAEPNTVYRVTTASRARTWFGPGSPLAQNCIDALREGAFPVYAVAPEEHDVEGEEVDDVLQFGSFDNSSVSEHPDLIEFTVNGSDADTVITYRDVESENPGDGEVYVNPVSGEYHSYEAPDTDGIQVDYTHYDYESAIHTMADEEGDRIDFFACLTEDRDVVDEVHASVKQMESNYEFAIAIAGAAGYIDNTSAYSNEYDSSRIQLIYPSRNADGESIVGSYVGLRSALGMSASPMRKRLAGQRDLYHRLSVNEKEDLVEARINPISDESAGSRVVEDVTTVSPENSDENQMQQGIARIVVDYVTLIVERNADAFIGELHTRSARNTLQSIITSELKDLLTQSAITGYNVSVQEEDSMTASVDVGIQTIKPLRNVLATVTAGRTD